MPGQGYNTYHGFDTGPPPPTFAQPPSFQQPRYAWPPAAPTFAPPPVYTYPSYPTQYPPYQPPPPPPQQPYSYPPNNPDIPGVQLKNHLGGTGLPPGYDYLFPATHARIHVFKTKEKPWQSSVPLLPWSVPGNPECKFAKLYVPTTITIKEFMKQLGCNNPEAKKNRLYEIVESGGGRWLKGMEIGGDQDKKVKEPISSLGWNETRTGEPGKPPLIWIYCTNT